MFSSSVQNGGHPCLQDMQIARDLGRRAVWRQIFSAQVSGQLTAAKI
jgi:hypothetical protein